MPKLIASVGPKRTMIGFYHKIIIMKSSITDKDLSIMVNYALQTIKEKRKTEETFINAGCAKFNSIPREGNPAIPIKYYKDQCRENMIRNGMWDVLSLPDLCNKEKKWYLLLHQSDFPWTTWDAT